MLVIATVCHGSLAAAQGWQVVQPMAVARSYHSAAVVGNRWYVAGGLAYFGSGGSDKFPSEVEVYDPAAGQWSVAGNLAQGRDALHAIADLSHGRVLFPGGFLPAGPDAYLALPTCDLVAPDGVQTVPNLRNARELHAVAFAAGKFIVSGGWGASSTLLDDAEMWDGVGNTWTPAGVMPAGPRSGHTMTTLANGRDVLVVGGCLPDRAMTEVDMFDAAGPCWQSASPTHVTHCDHAAVRLRDGRVLVAGGGSYSPIAAQTAAEIFDPATGRWATVAPMHDGRFEHEMVLLPDGRVLAAGGSSDPANGEYGALSSVEVYDPAADTWTTLPPMHDRRRWPTLAVLSDGVYVAGGSNSDTTAPGSGTVLASVERLGWTDLGLASPIDLDAGVPGEYVIDASSWCGPHDAGSARDAGPGSARPDGTTDVSLGDAGSAVKGTSRNTGGCSCSLAPATGDSVMHLSLGLVVWALWRRRSRRPALSRQ